MSQNQCCDFYKYQEGRFNKKNIGIREGTENDMNFNTVLTFIRFGEKFSNKCSARSSSCMVELVHKNFSLILVEIRDMSTSSYV
jgi:hypothetical protein